LDLYLISRSGWENYYRQEKFFDLVFEQKRERSIPFTRSIENQ
jgi:hypothetical protein